MKYLFLLILFSGCKMTSFPVMGQGGGLLHQAIKNKDIKHVQELVNSNYGKTEPDANGDTPLMIACNDSTIELDIINLLNPSIDDYFIRNNINYNSAIDYCIKNENIAIIKFLLGKYRSKFVEKIGEDNSYISQCIYTNAVESFKIILPLAKDVNKINLNEISLLEEAVNHSCFSEELQFSKFDWPEKKMVDFEKSLVFIKGLLDHGAIIDGNRVAIVTKSIRCPKVFQFLIENNLDIKSSIISHGKEFEFLDYFLMNLSREKKIALLGEDDPFLDTVYFEERVELIELVVIKSKSNMTLNYALEIFLKECVLSNNTSWVKYLLKDNKVFSAEKRESICEDLIRYSIENNFFEMKKNLKRYIKQN